LPLWERPVSRRARRFEAGTRTIGERFGLVIAPILRLDTRIAANFCR
jgi:hypothetical protein